MRNIRHEFEVACDRAVVVDYGADALRYSQLIVKTAALQRGMTLGFASGYRNTRDRLGKVLEKKAAPGRARRIAFAVLFVVVVACAAARHCSPSWSKTSFVHTRNVTRVGRDGMVREIMIECSGTYGIFGAYTDASSLQEISKRYPRNSDADQSELI